jgi:phosphatidylglycerol:prolipoprotein diacylglycerol transferase
MYPILFRIGSGTHAVPVHTFGVLLALAIIVAVLRTRSVANRRDEGITGDDVFDVSVWMVVAGLIGARLLFVATDWSYYRSSPASAMSYWNGGISFHGALIGGFLALVLFCRRRKIPLLKMCDLCAPSVMLGYAIGRVGCFFNGCCYGAPTTMPWGVSFYDEGHWTGPSHPTQLYAAGLSIVFFGLLVQLERRRRFEGQIFFVYLIAAAVERFIMEIWRAGVTSTGSVAGLTEVQAWCVAMAVVAGAGLWTLARRMGAGISGPGVVGVAQP